MSQLETIRRKSGGRVAPEATVQPKASASPNMAALSYAAMNGSNRYGRRFHELDLHRQVTVIVDVCGGQHKQRAKPVGARTKKVRAEVVHQAMRELIAYGFQIRSVHSLDRRHLSRVILGWVERGLAAATIQTRISILRWFVQAIGKGGMVGTLAQYGVDPERVKRQLVAVEDKSWSGRGIDSSALIEEARAMDRWVGCQLKLMEQFGLRLSEALLIKPRNADHGLVLCVEEGTKGGRTRVVPIRTPEQREALDAAISLSRLGSRGTLIHPDRTPAQARQRMYYVCRKLGITRADLGVTPHGMRHQYANDRYEEVSGTPSVVRGSSAILSDAREMEARQCVTRELGHARLRIAGSYLGAAKRPTARSAAHRAIPQSAREGVATARALLWQKSSE